MSDQTGVFRASLVGFIDTSKFAAGPGGEVRQLVFDVPQADPALDIQRLPEQLWNG